MKYSLFFLFLIPLFISAQDDEFNEHQAKEAVNKIVRYCGLHQNFVVRENGEVKTAVAFIKGKKRYIEYNPTVMAGIVDSSKTDWSAVSILAHEISHHLMGHTLDPGNISLGDELTCDKFSGFILHSMGATKEESLAAMEIAGNPHGTKTHPPKSARLEAILLGWEEAKRLDESIIEDPIDYSKSFTHKVKFEGDENNYYVDENQKLLWYNNYAQPIMFGDFQETNVEHFLYTLTWENQEFFVDEQLIIWQITDYEAHRKVGSMKSLVE